jgi:hypothetical protein
MFRPSRKIVPPARYKEGEPELATHHRVTPSTSVALTAAESTSSPLPNSSSPPPTDTEDTSSAADPSQAWSSLKRPAHSIRSSATLDSVVVISPTTSDDIPDPAPQTKKPKMSLTSSVSQTSIIDIDDIDDPREEQLNKSNATADIQEFFTVVPRLPGQTKGRMKCDPCA